LSVDFEFRVGQAHIALLKIEGSHTR
jgi:hypothetical protein